MVPDQQRGAGSCCTALLFLAAALCAVPSRAALFVPRDDAEVVEQLRVRPLDRTDIEYRRQRLLLRAAPDNLRLALAVARRSSEIARRDGDPRYLGYAQAALLPWWSLAEPAPAVRLLRANILQSTHQFPAALQELSQVLRAEPGNAQAWLTQASIYQVQGRYAEARASCQALPALGAAQYAEACLAEIAGLTGRPREARARLDALIRSSPAMEWLAIVQAELAERSGDFVAAEGFFRSALSATPDAYCKTMPSRPSQR